MSGVTLAEIENLFSDTITTVKDMDGMLRTVIATQATMAKAHSDIGSAFTMMARTFEKVEERQNQLELTNTSLYRDKGIPPNIFFIVSATLCVVIVLGAVWITDTFIKASFTNLEAGRRKDISQIQTSIDEKAKEILEEVKDGQEK